MKKGRKLENCLEPKEFGEVDPSTFSVATVFEPSLKTFVGLSVPSFFPMLSVLISKVSAV